MKKILIKATKKLYLADYNIHKIPNMKQEVHVYSEIKQEQVFWVSHVQKKWEQYHFPFGAGTKAEIIVFFLFLITIMKVAY